MSTDDDVSRALDPLPHVVGETSEQREARLLAHIGAHLTARDRVLRAEIGHLGERMDAALHHLGHELAAEVRNRHDEDRRLDDAVREIPERIMDLQDAMLQTKTELITAIQRAPRDSAPAPSPPSPRPPTFGTLVQTSRPVQGLVFALSALVAAIAVGVLAVAIGPEEAAGVLDKLPSYSEPEPAAVPAPVEPSSAPVPSPG